MVNLGLDGYEVRKTLTILAGESPCWVCGGIRNLKARYMCSTCKWHYGRAKYHAYYCWLLRAGHVERNTDWLRSHGAHMKCKRCIQFYGVNTPILYLERGGK